MSTNKAWLCYWWKVMLDLFKSSLTNKHPKKNQSIIGFLANLFAHWLPSLYRWMKESVQGLLMNAWVNMIYDGCIYKYAMPMPITWVPSYIETMKDDKQFSMNVCKATQTRKSQPTISQENHACKMSPYPEGSGFLNELPSVLSLTTSSQGCQETKVTSLWGFDGTSLLSAVLTYHA